MSKISQFENLNNQASFSRLRKVFEKQLEERNQRCKNTPPAPQPKQEETPRPESELKVGTKTSILSSFKSNPSSIRAASPYRSQDKRKGKVQFKDIYDQRSITDAQKERKSRERNFHKKISSATPPQSRSGSRNHARAQVNSGSPNERSVGYEITPQSSAISNNMASKTDQTEQRTFGQVITSGAPIAFNLDQPRLSPNTLKRNQRQANFMKPVEAESKELAGVGISEQSSFNKFFGIDTDMLKKSSSKNPARQQIKSSRTELFNLNKNNNIEIGQNQKTSLNLNNFTFHQDSSSEKGKEEISRKISERQSEITSSSHRQILQRALQMHNQAKQNVRKTIKNEKLADRSLRIINENKEFGRYEKSTAQEMAKTNDLNRKITQFKKQQRHKIFCKQQEGLERLEQIFAFKQKEKFYRRILDFSIDLADKEFTLEIKQQSKNGITNKLMRQNIFRRWIEAYHHKVNQTNLELKASRFRALNNKIKLKMILNKMKKILKSDKIYIKQVYVAMQKKYYLGEFFTNLYYQATKIDKIQAKTDGNLANRVFQNMKIQLRNEKQEVDAYYQQKMAFKILFILKRYKRERTQKKIFKKAAAKFLSLRLKYKTMRALGLKVNKNRNLRSDLVKRYWVHNSDDESEEADDQKFEDEFFPVTVCTKKQYLRLDQDSSNPNQFFILNDRSRIEVQYQDHKIKARDNMDLKQISVNLHQSFQINKPFVN